MSVRHEIQVESRWARTPDSGESTFEKKCHQVPANQSGDNENHFPVCAPEADEHHDHDPEVIDERVVQLLDCLLVCAVLRHQEEKDTEYDLARRK